MLKRLFGHKTSRKTAHPKEIHTHRANVYKTEFDNLVIDENDISHVRQVSDSKFPIHLLESTSTKQNFAVKVFSHTTEDSQTNFENETRFASLRHPNIIHMIKHEKDKECTHEGELKKFSCILMEYAPHGDLFDFIFNHKSQINDKLARTYFRQLIEGIEFLHANGVAHLDLKPENVLIGADYNLKICDFDLSWKSGDAKILSAGTKCCRAPEFINSKSSSKISFTADIYSAGIILFLLKSRGTYPHNEDENLTSENLFDLMKNHNSRFWKKHCEIQSVDASFFDSHFKELFNSMTKYNPKERLTIKKIKKSKWYNGPVYSPVELHDIMGRMFQY